MGSPILRHIYFGFHLECVGLCHISILVIWLSDYFFKGLPGCMYIIPLCALVPRFTSSPGEHLRGSGVLSLPLQASWKTPSYPSFPYLLQIQCSFMCHMIKYDTVVGGSMNTIKIKMLRICYHPKPRSDGEGGSLDSEEPCLQFLKGHSAWS